MDAIAGFILENPIRPSTSLPHQETKAKGLEEGANVAVELNETGTVIDLHRADERATGKK
jgi:hypothetical protein